MTTLPALTDAEERAAAELLSRGGNLVELETLLGGEHRARRNWRKAVSAWGLWAGHRGYPGSEVGFPGTFRRDYWQAVEAGRKMSMAELPG